MKMADTSYCIDYFRGNLSRLELPKFEKDLGLGLIAINPVIWVELVCGARGKREEKNLTEFLSLTKMVEFDDAVWSETARVARICVLDGVNVPLSDIQIQACALRYGYDLLFHDKHFGFIQNSLAEAQ